MTKSKPRRFHSQSLLIDQLVVARGGAQTTKQLGLFDKALVDELRAGVSIDTTAGG